MVEQQTTTSHLPELLRRLETGWRIEEPLLQRTVLHGADGRASVLEVVIRKDGERRVIALDDDPDVGRFLEERRLAIFEV